ncbi:acetate uptake transporter family protein [Rhodomicrobium lacus]|uniref:acetate uptake transporter family protein n=1 Tax=Rhodomicrobium lacus TaxID=2498452 RepID=UPI0026E1424B|nr:GPR1/FUN34/YaaH family transporter [Rhodomicrobium lacus]WKW52004.1 GPR1/FUN34/YaaH family transporter [Rhodomicrobium lacus]
MDQRVDSKFENFQLTTSPWANPTPAGLVGLAVACFCFFALLSGHVTKEAMPLLGLWLLGGFIIQFTVAILDYKSNNSTGGNTFLFFAAFFMFVGGVEMLMKYDMIVRQVPFDARIDGWAWVVLTLVLWLWTPAFLKNTALLFAIVALLDVALPFVALMDLGLIGKSNAYIPAWALLGAGIVGIYLSGALVVNTAFGRKVLPLPGPLVE